MASLPSLAPTLLALLVLGAAPPRGANEDVADDEKALKAAGVGVGGPALLEFFRQRTPNDAMRRRIDELVKQLGDDDYDRREKATRSLTAAGPAAVPALQRSAQSGDLEVIRRAQRCLKEINHPLRH